MKALCATPLAGRICIVVHLQETSILCNKKHTQLLPPLCRFTPVAYTCAATPASKNVVPGTTPVAVVTCPASCDMDTTGVFGTNVYHASSSLCRAALHAGVLTSAGGSVTVFFIAEDRAYTGALVLN